MTEKMTLVVGNKNYSSWSLRPWLALVHAGASFDEVMIPLYEAGSKEKILAYSPAGKVPALVVGDLVIWDSLAICEYVAETFPDAKLWPEDSKARAVARSVSAEMHSAFAALRRELSMDLRARIDKTWSAEAEADIRRIEKSWEACRATYGAGGPFLFGAFSIADCMYAPVVGRFTTYGVSVGPVAKAYMDAIWSLAPMQAWLEAARREPFTLSF